MFNRGCCLIASFVFIVITNGSDVILKSASVLPLSGSWIATNLNGSIITKARVPGNIYTDLLSNKIIEDPYYNENDDLYRWIGRDSWAFKKKFDVECHLLQKKRLLLIAHGIDTVANLYLNGLFIGSTDNMFVRYEIDIKTILTINNTIKIAIQSPVSYSESKHKIQILNYVIPPTCPPPVQHGECHVNYIRKMQSSFSWDWGPSFPTQGIWKPLEIVGFDTIIIRDITVFSEISSPKVLKNLTVSVFMEVASSDPINGLFSIFLDDSKIMEEKGIIYPDEKLNAKKIFELTNLQGINIDLWWPNGMGRQPLYSLTVVFSSEEEMTHKSVTVGFRKIELIQEPIANSSGLSFFFKVNGVPFFAKGSNWIPADSFPNRVSEQYLRHLLQSATDANMNMLRVWGGGIYESDEFYELANEMGLLIWQDLMFACALYPVDDDFLHSVQKEVTQQVRRLQHNPSLLLWAGNNENEQSIAGSWWPSVSQHRTQYKADYIKLYIDTIKPIVESEDPSRPFLPSSPSNGPESKEEGWISADPQDNHYGDVHFYTYLGDEWDPSTYPRARFVSEYGFQSYPSFESLANVSKPEDWVYPFNKFMTHRQHHMFGNLEIETMISKHFMLPGSSCGVQGFKDILYLSQIVQAVAIKTETEKYRRSQSEIVGGEGKTMGALYWQLNDIWPAPSWSSIEYGGKWKMLHYAAKRFFAPLLVSPHEKDNEVIVTVISDFPETLRNLTLALSIFRWSSFKPLHIEEMKFVQPPMSSNVVFRHNISGPDGLLDKSGCPDRNSCFFYFSVKSDTDLHLRTDNFLLLSEPKSAKGLQVPSISADVSNVYETETSNFTFNITLKTNALALFVWLEVDSVPGIFSDNGFLMVTDTVKIVFYSREKAKVKDIYTNLKIISLKNTCNNH